MNDIADALVAFLFSNGAGEKADRLVLTVDGPPKQDLGGWCREAVRDAVVAVIEPRISALESENAQLREQLMAETTSAQTK